MKPAIHFFLGAATLLLATGAVTLRGQAAAGAVPARIKIPVDAKAAVKDLERANFPTRYEKPFVPPQPKAEVPPAELPIVSRAAIDLVKEASDQSPKLAADFENARKVSNRTGQLAALAALEQEAKQQKNFELAGKLGLKMAKALDMDAKLDGPATAKSHAAVIAKYRDVIATALPPQQAIAKNNLSVLYLNQKDYGSARALLSEMDWANVPKDIVHVCRYNYGRSEEKSGDPAIAISQYRMALKLDPSFQPASTGAFRILADQKDFKQFGELAGELIANGQGALVRKQLHTALEAVSGDQAVPELLVPLVIGYATERLAPDEFKETEAPVLGKLSERAPGQAPMIAEITQAYATDVKPGSGQFSRPYPRWSETPRYRSAMSTLLKSIGDHYYLNHPGEKSEIRLAIVAYSSAWSLDHSNTDAALYTASVLQSQADIIDPDGQQLDALIEQLFEEKGQGYRIPVKTPEDFVNLLRLHLVLADIFEKKRRWGSEYDSHSAIFQLSRAVAMQEKLAELDPTFIVSPNLPARLAAVYVATNVAEYRERAFALYLKSAEGYLYYKNTEEAQSAYRNAAQLGTSVSPEDKKRFEAIQLALESHTTDA